MGNRCPDCNKFVSLETQEPEDQGVDLDTASVSTDIRISRNCSECGTELKSYDFNTNTDIPQAWALEHEKVEVADPTDPNDQPHGDWEVEMGELTINESGGSRYAKNMIGYSATVTVTCSCGDSIDIEVTDEVAASEFNDEA